MAVPKQKRSLAINKTRRYLQIRKKKLSNNFFLHNEYARKIKKTYKFLLFFGKCV